ncbi:hypothetical protein JHK82_032781 [Glycine max]|nr:hypothetical protein JHK82_032781 [Glycine max]KAG5139342.1 hypothetical protein JHK84_033110 [Glycine max]
MEKSKILVIGATGNLGYDLAEANLKFCHPTFALVGDSAFSDPIKAQELPFSKVRVSVLEDGYNFYAPKVEISRLVEAEGIPYTFISCNFFMRILLPSLAQPGLDAPPRDKVTIFGDGNTKGVFMKESDVAAFTINAVDDPRTLN